jgi:quercetin dioxygenase-like cupin family protein
MKCSMLLVLVATLLSAQSAPEVEITAESHHHLIFENKSVRIFYVEIPPNDATEMHWHRHDFIAVNLGSTEISNTVKDQPPQLKKLTPGDTHFSAASFAHMVHPAGAQPIRTVAVEILEDATLRNSPSRWDAAKNDVAKNELAKNEDNAHNVVRGGARQVLFVKDGIRVSESELQPGAVSPLHRHFTPHIIVPVSEFDLRSDEEGKAPITTHYKPGTAQWIDGGFSHTLTNTSSNPAKYVTLDLP